MVLTLSRQFVTLTGTGKAVRVFLLQTCFFNLILSLLNLVGDRAFFCRNLIQKCENYKNHPEFNRERFFFSPTSVIL